MVSNRPRSSLNGDSKNDKQCPLEDHSKSISQKEKAYHREHAVAKKLENENRCPGTLRGLSADSPRASAGLIAHRTSESCIPHFETSIFFRTSQGWVAMTTINLRVFAKVSVLEC